MALSFRIWESARGRKKLRQQLTEIKFDKKKALESLSSQRRRP
jgi:hypothetical protein